MLGGRDMARGHAKRRDRLVPEQLRSTHRLERNNHEQQHGHERRIIDNNEPRLQPSSTTTWRVSERDCQPERRQSESNKRDVTNQS